MKYPWISLLIVVIWLASSAILILRPDARADHILEFALVSATVLVFVGFKSPK